MKKFFNDHVGLFFALAVVVAGVALYLSLKANKDNKTQSAAIGQIQQALTLVAAGNEPAGNEPAGAGNE